MKIFHRKVKIARSRFWCFWGLIFAVSVIFSVETYAGNSVSPDRIVYNALVYRGQGAWAQGFATNGQVFSAVGTSEQMLALANKYPNAELIDGEGRLIVPGFNDVHVHAFPLNMFGIPINDPSEWIPGPGPDKQELLSMLAEASSKVPPGTWLWAFVGDAILDDALHGSNSPITRWDIDAVTPDHPVVVMGWGGHGLLVDSQVMAKIGLDETDPDPWAGWYGRTNGVNDGWCWEYAEYQAIADIRALIPAEQIAPQLNAVLLDMAKLGVTSIQTMDFFDDSIYKATLDEAGTLARVRIISVPLTYEESLKKSGRSFNPYAKVNVYGVKWVSDGTPIERLTAMEEDYTGWPDWSGVFNFPLGDWLDMVADGLKFPLVKEQRIFHAIGDRTIGNLVTAMEEAAPNWMWRFHRLRIEHGEFASLYAEQLAAKNVVVAYNPIHHSFPQMFIPRYGEQRMADMYKMRTVKNAGIKIALGSDAMGLIKPMTGEGIGGNPFLQIFLAVINPTNPAEGLTVEEAVDAYTYGSAYAEFMEVFKGTISVGKLADYAILSQNIFDEDLLFNIPGTYSVRTVCGGEDTYVLGQ